MKIVMIIAAVIWIIAGGATVFYSKKYDNKKVDLASYLLCWVSLLISLFWGAFQ